MGTKQIQATGKDEAGSTAWSSLRVEDDGSTGYGTASDLVSSWRELSEMNDQGARVTFVVDPVGGTPGSGSYSRTKWRAILLFQASDGRRWEAIVPAPKDGIFIGDDVDEDNADVLNFITDVIAVGRAPGDVTIAEYRRGYRVTAPEV